MSSECQEKQVVLNTKRIHEPVQVWKFGELGFSLWFNQYLHQGCILSPCLFNLHAEYIMRNAKLDEVQAGIKIAGRNINHLRYADDTPLWQKVKRN